MVVIFIFIPLQDWIPNFFFAKLVRFCYEVSEIERIISLFILHFLLLGVV